MQFKSANLSPKLDGILERQCASSSESMSRFGMTKTRVGPDGRPVIRYTTLLSFLRRVALTHNLQLTPLTSADTTTHRTSAWRLGSECFAVQICVTSTSSSDYDGSAFVPGANNFDELVHVSAVCFELSQEQSMSPELVADLNAGKFESLAQHINSLMTIYSIPGSNLERVRAYLCLHVLEEDLSVLSQTLRADLTEAERNAALALRPLAVHTMDLTDRQRMVNSSIVGLFLNRSGGRLARLTYLITSAQTAMAKAADRSLSIKSSRSSGFPGSSLTARGTSVRGAVEILSNHGFSARVGLRSRVPFNEFATIQSTVQHLPIIPLVTLRETSFGDSVPDFAEPDELKCVALEAELVLYLDPPIPLPTEAVRELELITGLKNPELLDKDEDDLTRLILAQHNQHYLYGINPHILLPNYTQHSYTIRSHVRGFMVHTVPFTCSSQISSIIAVLRKHASLVAFYETFVLHPSKPYEKDDLLTFRFDIEISSEAPLRVSFDHPCDPSRRVGLSLDIGPFGVTRAKLDDGFLISDANAHVMTNLDSTVIFARSHSLPVGLVWLLLRLGCPVQRSLRVLESSRSMSALNDVTSDRRPGLTLGHHAFTNTTRLEQLRTMLNRARSQVLIQGATGTGGILSGADRFAAPELDTPLLHPLPTMPALSARGSLKLSQLPPGVLATPPPVLPHTEHNNSLDMMTNALSTVRGIEPSGKSLSTSGVPSPSVITPGSRGLRLDDLLIGNVIQQCFSSCTTASTTCLSMSTVSNSTPGSTVLPVTGSAVVSDYPAYNSNAPPTNLTQGGGVGSQSKIVAAMREFTPEQLTSPGLCSTVSPKQSATMTGPQSGHNGTGNYINIANSCTPYGLSSSLGPRAGSVSVSTPNISIPGTFTQSSPIINPLLGSKSGTAANATSSKTPNSGSMLVNLLNEDPLPPVTPSLSTATHCLPSPRLGPVPTQPPPGLTNYPDTARDPYAMPGTTVPGRYISSPQDKLSGKILGTIGNCLPSGTPHIPGVTQQSKSTGLHSPRSTGSLMTSSTSTKSRPTADAYNLPGSVDSVLTTAGPVMKKVRKRRRAGTDSSSAAPSFKPSSNANPVSGVGSLSTPSSAANNSTPIKHSRMESSTIPHGSLHRSTFGGASNTATGTVNNFVITPSSSSSSLPTAPSTSYSGPNAPTSASSGKSVYDFDDNPNSSFDMPNLPQNNTISASYQSCSTTNTIKLANPSSTYVSGAPSSTSLSVHPPNLGLSSAVNASSVGPVTERTVERKASLKMTIKTLPPQQQQHQSKITEVISSGNKLSSPEMKPKHLASGATVPGLKRRKRRSIEGKPSSYMLQMLQPPTSANTSTIHSTAPLTGMKLAKSNVALSHANSIVKKERKRRMTHMMTDRVNSVTTRTVPSDAPVISASESTLSVNTTPDFSMKSSKSDRSRESSVERSRTKPLQLNSSGITERMGSSGAIVLPSPSGSGVISRKKVTSSPLSGMLNIGDESQPMKRQYLSTTGATLPHSDSGELKRRKHSDISRHSMSSNVLNLSGSSVSESDDGQTTSSASCDPAGSTNSGTLKHITKHSASFAVGNSNPTTGRTGTGVSSNPTSKLSTAPSYTLSSQGPTVSTSSGLGTPGGTGGTTVGLIKGYKIPKKKTNNQSNPVLTAPGLGKSDSSANNSLSSSTPIDMGSKQLGKPLLTELARDSSDHTGYSSGQNLPNCLTSHTPAVPHSTVHTSHSVRSDVTPIGASSQVQQQQQQQPTGNVTATTTAPCANTSAVLSSSQPRRRISDIVDKLRAKSSTSSSGTSGPNSASGGGTDVPVTSDADRANSSSEPFDTNAIDVSGGQPDQRDNIFEKFSSSAPTPTESSKQPAQGDVSNRSPVFGSDSNLIQDSGSNHVSPSHHILTDDGAMDRTNKSVIAGERPIDASSVANTKSKSKQYELIKAQTDTPASPTEASTLVPTPTSDSASKIIPISPTSAKRMEAGQTQSGATIGMHTDRVSSQSRGALISRKNPSSTRFSRPNMGVSSSHPHSGVPDGYMRSMAGHPRGGRPPRVFSHGMVSRNLRCSYHEWYHYYMARLLFSDCVGPFFILTLRRL
ncbi:hypothetical protein D915_008763 [Fasciola hepatica]|uniref:Mediator of RNA polymerase II transcription subunit 1 n=1 Tax=Fasciola hepatica TaxID=6192 RepID=A0A4E0QYQ5_FASHE|nr:hypothetical protein D915_008763 [Fasciola hepatica]